MHPSIRLISLLSFIACGAGLAADEIKIEDLPFTPLPKVAPAPKDNPTTPAKVNLGRQLFFDPRLSKDGSVSCASCHNVMSSGGDNQLFSFGVLGKRGGRSSPTVWNAAFHSVQFWDGRAPTLEEQAKGPLTNPVEMAMDDHDLVVYRVKNVPGYVESFKKVFGGTNPITIDTVAKAIAAYERTLITPSRFDKYLRGNRNALTPQEKKGLKTVLEVGCTTCHNGVNMNGPEMPVGEAAYQKFPTFTESEYVSKYKFLSDKGRAEHTKNEEDAHFWRVPTWRNVALTAPYFHNGSVKTLDEAVRVMGKVQLNKDLTDEQVKDIVAFLNALTGEFPRQPMPILPPTPGKAIHLE